MNDFATVPRATTSLRPPRTWLRLTLMLLAIGVVAGGLVWFQHFKSGILNQVVASIRSEQPTVATAQASMQEWKAAQTAVGTARASKGADLAAEIGGVVDQIDFESGQTVPAGTVLLRLRPNDDAAKLAQLQANADLAGLTLQRDQKQLAAHGVAQATVDADAANLKVTNAQVSGQQAVMAEKTVRAPFDGRLGVRQVDVGQFISAGTAIVTLQQLDPMFVDFYLPQQGLGEIAVGQTVEVTSDAWPGRTFAGKISSLNSKVDPASRMLQIRAAVPNADGALLPGMYVGVSIATGKPRQLVTIPAAAVAFNPYGTLVYVMHDEKAANGTVQHVVRQQFVTTGTARGDQVSILKGVDANDIVVTAGQLKLHNGSLVKIDNTVQPTDDAAPRPQDH
jgi:membrane fusion protein (multidrug efflux system)